ncbi:hypothetical protein [Kitasatospora cineracea]|uniref:Uncharacterized protein n=1 Tax=Kitasatospora cineracea TaxID=88074 RepID=A0A8G1XAT4_9ACTN|nr:hypothetical protein [Kitasatospora cineracea]ROR42934.1 hypothetical protein EDD39_1069 [Kitasatospora cineracea]
MAAPRYIEYQPLDQIRPAARNPKGHDDGGLDRSVDKFDFTEPGLLDERTGRLVAGHGRYETLERRRAAGKAAPDGVVVTEDGTWTVPVVRGWASRDDAHAEAYLVASNQLTTAGGWDGEGLAALLSELEQADPALAAATGFDQQQLDALLADLAPATGSSGPDQPQDQDAGPTNRGDLLALAGVTVGEPEHQVETGQVWELGEHRLVIGEVFDGWPLWAPLLTDGSLFLPYPTPLAPFADRALRHRLVMVQPERYLAGHLLDKWARISGQTPVLADSR